MALSNAHPHIAPRIEKYEDTRRSFILSFCRSRLWGGVLGCFDYHKRGFRELFFFQTLHGADFICLASTFDKVIVFIVPAQSLVKYEVDYNKKKSGHHEVYYNH